MDWRHHAACLHEDPEPFFPIGDPAPALIQLEEAKAFQTRQDAGVWGGRSEGERRSLSRSAARARRRVA